MILFVTTNPSKTKTCPAFSWVITKSEKNFNGWLEYLVPNGIYKTINISDKVLGDSQPFQSSDYDLLKLSTHAHNVSTTKIVALGNNASSALNNIGMKHYKLPHPSPLNNFLKNEVQVEAVLEDCKQYLEKQV